MRPYATSVWGLKLLVQKLRPSATSVWGLKLKTSLCMRSWAQGRILLHPACSRCYMCAAYVSSYCLCPHSTMYVSSYCCFSPFFLFSFLFFSFCFFGCRRPRSTSSLVNTKTRRNSWICADCCTTSTRSTLLSSRRLPLKRGGTLKLTCSYRLVLHDKYKEHTAEFAPPATSAAWCCGWNAWRGRSH